MTCWRVLACTVLSLLWSDQGIKERMAGCKREIDGDGDGGGIDKIGRGEERKHGREKKHG